MSSILTNTGAMTALQTLRGINKNLAMTQNEISTGKAIGSARDGAAIWSISKVMESDVKGFQQIANSLSLGQSTIGVARTAAESVTDVLTEIKSLIVSAQEENVDRSKIQTDISRLRDQISSVVSAAQFNGLSLLSNRETAAPGQTVNTANIVANIGSRNVNVLGSLDRASNGTVTATNIAVGKSDLAVSAGVAGGGTDIAATAFTVSGAAAAALGSTATLTVVGDVATAARGGNRVLAGDSYAIGGLTGVTGAVRYVARDGDTVDDIARNIATQINLRAAESNVNLSATVSGAVITLTNNTGAAVTATSTLNTGGTVSGGLEALSLVNVTTESGARAALSAIEGMITTATNAAANLGSAQRRMDIQAEFVSQLVDSFKSGIGTLVDANMEEASARLQALQVQQQLGIQSLSIANQAPQSILALFR